jgi:beta-glucanase (GH16 family)
MRKDWVTCSIVVVLMPIIIFSTPRPSHQSKWKLIWLDEFNAIDGSRIDRTKWTEEIGGHGWGNNELQFYTNRIENAVVFEGSLNIKALKEQLGVGDYARNYTSARVITKNKFSVKYGRIEARIKLPFGQGIWPAFWMLGDDIDKVGWPRSGEIDIMEYIGREPLKIYGTLHGPGYSGAKGPSSSYQLPGGAKFADGFHIFAVEWEPEVIRFYCDDVLYSTRTPRDLPEGTKWVFDHPFFILLNVAVGGNWPGNPDATTTFPQTMMVDYVRVYQKT